MTELHPLTQAILEHVDTKNDMLDTEAIDALITDYVTPPVLVTESGVRFPDLPDTPVEVAGNFIQSGHQMQMALIGSEPVLLVQPEYDAEEGRVTLITTAVDLPPAGLLHVLDVLADGVKTIVQIQAQQEAEQAEADAALRDAQEAFDLAQLPETPEG